jgi:hypothetical protein
LDIWLIAQQICSGQNPAWDGKGKPKGWPKERQSDFEDNSIVISSTCWSMFQIDFGICNWPFCALLHPFLTYPWKYDMDPTNAGGRGRLSSSVFFRHWVYVATSYIPLQQRPTCNWLTFSVHRS